MTLLTSWITSANTPDTDFPLNNLPCGVFSTAEDDPRCGVAIGDMVLDVATLEAEGLLNLGPENLLDVPFWNAVMEAGPGTWAALRTQLTALLREGASKRFLVEDHLIPQAKCTLHMPFLVSEYTDFFSGHHHAANVAAIAGKDMPEAWPHMPQAYAGRASTVVVSGTPIRRPHGQLKSPKHQTPIMAPTRRFDFELELGAVIGTPSDGPVTVDQADQMIFGYVLLNDWSARDVQAWESTPMGPFQSKSAATTISPWIVMAAALAPFRAATPPRKVPLLAYVADTTPMLYDIALTVGYATQGAPETEIARTSSTNLYYSAAQQLAHHTLSGCTMSSGDLLGSGTISGPTASERGSMLELSWAGRDPLTIGTETRSFLQDGDTVTFRGAAMGQGYRIGFGTCQGQILPALPNPYAQP
jgi:fumarylacetoacetase